MEFRAGNDGRAQELNRQAIREVRYRIEHLEDAPSWELGWLGAALLDDGDLDGAIDCYRRGMELRPVRDNPYIHAGLAEALASKGDLEEAVRVMERLVALRPDNVGYQRDLGATRVLLLLRDRGLDAAIAALHDAVEGGVGDPSDVRDLLAQRLMTLRPKRLLEILTAGSEADPGDLESDLQALWAEVVRIVEEVPGDSADALRRRGFYRYRLGDLEGARPYLEESFARRETAFGAFYLALLHGLTGDPTAARPWYDRGSRILAEQPYDPSYSYTEATTNRVKREVEDVLGLDPGR